MCNGQPCLTGAPMRAAAVTWEKTEPAGSTRATARQVFRMFKGTARDT